MFYLISIEYVGANKLDSRGHIIGDSETVQLTTTPPKTNMSGEVLVNGWLGTTNDWSHNALGEFKTLEDALEELKILGFTSRVDSDSCNVVSEWQRPSAALEKWSAEDWLLNTMGAELICKDYDITAETTDDELEIISDNINKEAEGDNVNLFGSMELLMELRNDLRD